MQPTFGRFPRFFPELAPFFEVTDAAGFLTGIVSHSASDLATSPAEKHMIRQQKAFKLKRLKNDSCWQCHIQAQTLWAQSRQQTSEPLLLEQTTAWHQTTTWANFSSSNTKMKRTFTRLTSQVLKDGWEAVHIVLYWCKKLKKQASSTMFIPQNNPHQACSIYDIYVYNYGSATKNDWHAYI